VGVHPRAVGDRLTRAHHTATHLSLGQQVKPADRHNIGVVTGIDDHNATATVCFTSASGRSATRSFPWDEIQIVTPPNPEPRELTPEIEAHLEAITRPARDQVEAWHRILQAAGVAPGDADRYSRAAAVAADRAAARLVAIRPTWLTDLLGDRPTTAQHAHAWDDAVREIAAYRARSGVEEAHQAIGPCPLGAAEAETWHQVTGLAALTRTWLDRQPDHIGPVIAGRSVEDLVARRTELDAILDTAPPDHRHLIAQLRSGDQLPFDNTADVLRAALEGEASRRDWILTHWPHIVEHAEIERASLPPAVTEARPRRAVDTRGRPALAFGAMTPQQAASVVGFILGGLALVISLVLASTEVTASGQTYFGSVSLSCGSVLSPRSGEDHGDGSAYGRVQAQTNGLDEASTCDSAREDRQLFAMLAGMAGVGGIAVGLAKRRDANSAPSPDPVGQAGLAEAPPPPPPPTGGSHF